jgi:hypothetical protein
MGREIRGNAGQHNCRLAPIHETSPRMAREREVYSGIIENFSKKVSENLFNQQKLIIFVMSLRQRDN